MKGGDEGQGQQGSDKGEGMIKGFREPEPVETGPTLEDAFAGMRESDVDVTPMGGPDEPVEGYDSPPAQPRDEPRPEQAPSPEREPAEEGLPEGFTEEVDSRGQEHIRGPDGLYYSRGELERYGADAKPLPEEQQPEGATKEGPEGEGEEISPEEAEDFFEGDEPEEVVEIALSDDEEGEVLEIGLDDEEAAERLRQMQEDAREVRNVRAQIDQLEEARTEVREQLMEAELLEEEMRTDPAGFLVERIESDQLRARVVEEILLESEDVRHRASELLTEWSRDPTAMREKRLDRREERTERRKQMERRREYQRRAREVGQEINDALEGVVPEDMPSSRASKFREYAKNEVFQYIAQNELQPHEFSVEQVPEIIGDLLEIFGLEWKTTSNGSGSSNVRRAEPGGEEEAELARKARESRRTGERLRAARVKRRKAGHSAPAGAGSPGTRNRPPEDADLEDALEWSRGMEL